LIPSRNEIVDLVSLSINIVVARLGGEFYRRINLLCLILRSMRDLHKERVAKISHGCCHRVKLFLSKRWSG
jgi:hypothetical protein